MNNIIKKIGIVLLLIALLPINVIASNVDTSEEPFYIQTDGKDHSDVSDVKYVSSDGLIDRVDTISDNKSLDDIGKELKTVGQKTHINLKVTYKPNVVIKGYVYRDGVEMESSVGVIKVPEYNFEPIYLDSQDSIKTINEKLEASAIPMSPSEVKNKPRFYFDDISQVYDTFYGSVDATVKYQYKKAYLPISKRVTVYRINTVPAVITKDMNEESIISKIKESINYSDKDSININKSDIKSINGMKRIVPFTITKKDSSDVVYQGTVIVEVVDKELTKDESVLYHVHLNSGLQRVDVIGDTKLYGAKFDGWDIIYTFKKGSSVELETRSDARYNLTKVDVYEDRDKESSSNHYVWSNTDNTNTISGKIDSVNKNATVDATLDKGKIVIHFEPEKPLDGILQPKYEDEYTKVEKITSPPHSYLDDIENREDIYDTTEYRNQFENIMNWKDLPAAEGGQIQKLYYGWYGTGKIAIRTKRQDRDYVYVGDNVEDLVKGNSDLIVAKNADLSKTTINPEFDTSSPSELKDKDNIKGDVIPQTTNVTYFADSKNDKGTESTKTVPLTLKVFNRGESLQDITINRKFEDNIAYKTDKGFIYNNTIQEEIEKNVQGRINGKVVNVYLTEIQAKKNSESNGWSYYLELGNPSNKDHEKLPGFTKENGNNVPKKPEDIKNIYGEITVEKLVLYEKGKEVISLNKGQDLDKYRVGDKYLYRFGQYQFTSKDLIPKISYSIGYDEPYISERGEISFNTDEVVNSLDKVTRYRDFNGINELYDYDTGKLFISNGKIASTSNVKYEGAEVPNSTYLEKLIFSSLPKVGEKYVKKITVEDITNYESNCDEAGKNCQKINFNEITYDENIEDSGKKQIRPAYNIKTKLTIEYEPHIISANGTNIVSKEYTTKINIVKKKEDTNVPGVTKIEYISGLPKVYKGGVPNPEVIKNSISISIDGEKVDAKITMDKWDTSRLGYSDARIKIEANGSVFYQPITILVVDNIKIEKTPNDIKNIGINKEKAGDIINIYDTMGKNIVKQLSNLNELDGSFGENFKQSAELIGGNKFDIIYDPSGNIEASPEHRIVVNNIEFNENDTSKIFNGNNPIYPRTIDSTIYTKYYHNNNTKDVSEGILKLRLTLSDFKPSSNLLKEFNINGKSYYLHYQVYDKNTNTGPIMLINPENFINLYTPLNVIENYKQLFTINFNHGGKTISSFTVEDFANRKLLEDNIPPEVKGKLDKYKVRWDFEEYDKSGILHGGLILDKHPKVVNIDISPVDYKINILDHAQKPINPNGVKLSGTTASGTVLKDIISSIDGYIPSNKKELEKLNNFVFTKDNKEVTLNYVPIPNLDVQNIISDELVYPNEFDVNEYLKGKIEDIMPEITSDHIKQFINDGIIKQIDVVNADSDPYKLEDKDAKLIIKYFDGQIKEYGFKYNYKIGYKINSNQFVNKTIKVGEELPTELSWVANFAGIESFKINIKDFMENKVGEFDVEIIVTDKGGNIHEPIYKKLIVLENVDNTEPDVNPDGKKPGESGQDNTNPDTKNPDDHGNRPILPGEELTPGNNNKGGISEINPGTELTPKKPGNDSSDIVVPGEVENNVNTGNTESNSNNVVVGESENAVVNNGTDNINNQSSGGTIGNIESSNNPLPNYGSNFSAWESGTKQDTPTYSDINLSKADSSKKDDKTLSSNNRYILEESIKYADNIILNSKKYNKSSYMEFLNKYEEIKNLINSNENITKDKANVLNEELVKSIRELKSKGFFSKKPAIFVELDLRNPKLETPIKDAEGNVVGTHKLTGDPKLINDRTYLSVRDVANILGMEVNWNNSNRTATFTKDSKIISVNIDTKDVFVDGNKQDKLDNDIKLINDRIYCPLTNISKYFGITNGNNTDGINQDIEYYDNGTVRIYIK